MKMDSTLHSGLTIAFICNGNEHPTVINYNKFGKKYWDDSHTNSSKIGYYFAYYFQKKFVYIHKIINIVQPVNRPSSMDWASNRQILCLSEQLKEFSWDDWVRGIIGMNAPYTPTYNMTPTRSWSYETLQQHHKFSAFNFIQFKNSIEKSPIHSIEDEYDLEHRRLLELIKENNDKKTRRDAQANIERLRTSKWDELQKLIEEERMKISESEKHIKELTNQQIEYKKGKFDTHLVSVYVLEKSRN